MQKHKQKCPVISNQFSALGKCTSSTCLTLTFTVVGLLNWAFFLLFTYFCMILVRELSQHLSSTCEIILGTMLKINYCFSLHRMTWSPKIPSTFMYGKVRNWMQNPPTQALATNYSFFWDASEATFLLLWQHEVRIYIPPYKSQQENHLTNKGP